MQRCANPFPSFRHKLRQTLRLAAEAEETVAGGHGWLIGAALFVRRDALRRLDGGFLDTGYFMYWEDTDLCARLLRAGWELAIFRGGARPPPRRREQRRGEGGQRPELHACFLRGKYRWLRRYWSARVAYGLWALDAVEAGRKFLRAVAYRRRAECVQARTLAGVLGRLSLRDLGSTAT